jgi:hypothetical protein
MKQLLLEKKLENKLIPSMQGRADNKVFKSDSKSLAVKLAEKSLHRIFDFSK